MMRQTLDVTLSEKKISYPIYIGTELLSDSAVFAKHIRGRDILIVTNDTIAPLYLETIQRALHTFRVDQLILPDGEIHKNLTQFSQVIDVLADHQHHRDTTLIALGGGVIGDITGFAAACYQRGVDYIQIPTTLLAQVDASIGGKTAINHRVGKNLIGAFHQPRAVIIDVQTLNTLGAREFNSGIAEIIKAALIADADFFTWLEQHLTNLMAHDKDTLILAITKASNIKRNIVMRDEKETMGQRILLNLGHTFAHAIEHVLGYGEWLHGEAVSMGMLIAAKISAGRGLLSQQDVSRIEELLIKAKLPVQLPNSLKADSLFSALIMDKKATSKRLRFILMKTIGEAMIADDLSETEIKAYLK